MPRIPKPMGCDCHIPVSAGEDIKLKVMEEILKSEIKAGIKDISYTRSETVGNEQFLIYTIYLTDGRTYEFKVRQGSDGASTYILLGDRKFEPYPDPESKKFVIKIPVADLKAELGIDTINTRLNTIEQQISGLHVDGGEITMN